MRGRESFDAVVIGAGVVGAACAHYLAREGLGVVVVDRGGVAGGTTGAGEGNLLVSDKPIGPELDLALLSSRLWRELAPELGEAAELELKGGLVVATEQPQLATLLEFAARQRAAGLEAAPVAGRELRALEPNLAEGLAGGVSYPQDMQVQPMLATAHLLRLAREQGATLRSGCTVTGIDLDADGVSGVDTSDGRIGAPVVVNAAGTWAGEVAQLAGVRVPILPRRGFVLVTEPLPQVIRRKVYSSDYVTDVASSDPGLESSAVVEGTKAGTVLIGATRERVGFDPAPSPTALGRLAAQAVALFPFLGEVRALRAYRGFRPYSPDHLPVIGPDPRAPGLLHACGHEGAGIGLAPATGRLIAQAVVGAATDLSLRPFAPERFEAAGA